MKLCRSGNMKQYLKNNLLQKLVEMSGKAVRKALGNIFYCKIVLIQLFYWKGGKTTIFSEQATLQIAVPKFAMLA